MVERSDQMSPARELQGELQDLLCLAVVGDHVRWVVTGDASPKFAAWLNEATAAWRAWADQLAKHIVTLGVAPDGRVRSLAKDIPWNWVPAGWLSLDEAQRLVADRMQRLVEWAGLRQSQATEPETARLLGVVYSGLQTQLARLPMAG